MSFQSLFLLLSCSYSAFAVQGDYCSRSRFTHFYERHQSDGTVIHAIYDNYFPETAVQEYAMTEQLCVDGEGMPVLRRCLASDQWEDLSNITCQWNEVANELSERLNLIQAEVKDRKHTAREVMLNMSDVMSKSRQRIRPVDMLNVNRVINALASEPKDEAVSRRMIALYNQLMDSDETVLRHSASLNATNSLLHNFEEYMDELAHQLGPLKSCGQPRAIHLPQNFIDVKLRNGLQILIGGNISVFYLYPACNQFTGIAIYDRQGSQRRNCLHHRYWYRLLYANQSREALKAEPGLRTAAFLTTDLWTELRQRGATYLIFKVYANNGLFVETGPDGSRSRLSSFVLSISIPQISEKLPHPLVFLLRKDVIDDSVDEYCGYWEYGSWSRRGVLTLHSGQRNDPIAVCSTNHLTQFAFLMGGSQKQHIDEIREEDMPESQAREALLDAVTAIGCGLSIFGLLGIWLTASLSRKWRSSLTTKLLLHLTLAMVPLFGLMLLIYINEWVWKYSFSEQTAPCIVLGATIQYAVLLLFSWMLVLGHQQYQRHVKVFVVRSSHKLVQVVTIAWLLPLPPTLLLLVLSSDSYTPIANDVDNIAPLCYPSGKGLIYAVMMPIGVVLAVNVITVLCIFCTLSRMVEREGHTLLWQQLRLFVLLFFMLGLSWIFGICTYFQLGFVVNLVFCIMATVHGFVLFVFFVLFDKVARQSWLHLLTGLQQNNFY